jgi:two-component system nitrate/nitrite sensor histidine kinase NarX
MTPAPVANHPASPVGRPGLLAALAADLAEQGDLNQLLLGFLQTIVGLARANAGAVRVLDDTLPRMRLVGQVGLPAPVQDHEQWVNSNCGVCGAARLAEGPVWAGEAAACSLRRPGDLFQGAGCQHVLAVPLRHRGQVLGVCTLFYAATERPDDELLAVLKAAGDLLGLALEKARLERRHLQDQLQQQRHNMAADVHDSVAQSLAFVKMRLPLLHDALLAHDDERSLRYCEDIRSTVSEAHIHLRQILADLRTPADPLGLGHALQVLAQDFGRRSGLAMATALDLADWTLPPEAQTQVFLIVQEALANVARHARASSVRLAARRGLETLELLVEDDGAGLPAQPQGADENPPLPANGHYGLDIMRTRAARLGGELTLQPRAEGGTRVHLRLPLPAGDAGAAPR